MRRTSPAASGRDSGAHWALSRFRDSASDCLSSRGSRKTLSLAVMFHVKQFLFLPVLNVKQSCFSVRQAAARPIPSLLCHSERQRRIFALDLQAVVSVGRQSSLLLRESSDYNCGCMMKRKDSSSQAPQNDKEKRNDGVSRPKLRLFPMKHHSDPLYIVPFPMRA